MVARENRACQAIENKSVKMVEAGGVEPPSEKRYGSKNYMLIAFDLFRRLRLERARRAAS